MIRLGQYSGRKSVWAAYSSFKCIFKEFRMVKKIIRYFAMKDSYSFITYGMSILQIDAKQTSPQAIIIPF